MINKYFRTVFLVALQNPIKPVSPAETSPTLAISSTALNNMFRSYGDQSGLWNGGDSTMSISLPNSRVAWFFSDTFIGPINPDGTRPRNTPMVHNSIVVQQGEQLATTLISGTPSQPRSLVGGESDGDVGSAGFWVGDGTLEGSKIKVLYSNFRKRGNGTLDLALDGIWLATFDARSLELESLVDMHLGAEISWGSAILEDNRYTYIYGVEFGDGGMKFAHVARAPIGGIGGAWEFWTASAWSKRRQDSARILTGVGTVFGVQKLGGEYLLITMPSDELFSPKIVAYTANSPSGPFTRNALLYTTPEVGPGRSTIAYDARLHKDLARPGKLLISYNVNSLFGDDNYSDARLYRPRFVEVEWPPKS